MDPSLLLVKKYFLSSVSTLPIKALLPCMMWGMNKLCSKIGPALKWLVKGGQRSQEVWRTGHCLLVPALENWLFAFSPIRSDCALLLFQIPFTNSVHIQWHSSAGSAILKGNANSEPIWGWCTPCMQICARSLGILAQDFEKSLRVTRDGCWGSSLWLIEFFLRTKY